MDFHPARWKRPAAVKTAERLRPWAGVFLLSLQQGPPVRTIVFFDGQNIYHLAKTAWAPRPKRGPTSYSWPSYDVQKLASTLVNRVSGRNLSQIRFYTGVPYPQEDRFWHGFWSNKLRYLSSQGIYVYRGRINPGGQEKGVDVSLAVDLIRLTYERRYEVAIILSQDWDFGSAVRMAKEIAKDQGRALVFESPFPYEPGLISPRGVPGTRWVHIDKATYDSCHDPTDYRPIMP